MKILSPKLASYPGYLDQFNREAETAARLLHPYISKIIDNNSAVLRLADGEPFKLSYLCMELMPGGSLAEIIQKGESIVLPRILGWARILGGAFDYIHGQQVVHAGVKPSAIVFDGNDNPYLTDFAIASHFGDTGNLAAVGSPPFLAPEQWEGGKPVPATDQYAFAAVLYLLITGMRPFEGQEKPEVRARNFLRGPIPAHEEASRQGRTGIPPPVSKVLARAMSTRPEDRYGTMAELVHALDLAISGKASSNPKIFLSYRREESAGWAALIARDLKERYGISAFIDTQGPEMAGHISARLENAIKGCDVFVCLLGKTTLNFNWVLWEIRIAHEAGKPMVPIFQEGFSETELSESHEPGVAELLGCSGLYLLDRINIHIEFTVAELARIVKFTVESPNDS